MTRAKKYSWKMTQIKTAQEKTARTLYQIAKVKTKKPVTAALKAEKHRQKRRKRLRKTTVLSKFLLKAKMNREITSNIPAAY